MKIAPQFHPFLPAFFGKRKGLITKWIFRVFDRSWSSYNRGYIGGSHPSSFCKGSLLLTTKVGMASFPKKDVAGDESRPFRNKNTPAPKYLK